MASVSNLRTEAALASLGVSTGFLAGFTAQEHVMMSLLWEDEVEIPLANDPCISDSYVYMRMRLSLRDTARALLAP